MVISDFLISAQSLMNKNCHNSRTSDDVDIKLGPVTKFDKRNTATLQKIVDGVISKNCGNIFIFRIYGQFGVIQKPDSRDMICKTYIFINSNPLSYKN